MMILEEAFKVPFHFLVYLLALTLKSCGEHRSADVFNQSAYKYVSQHQWHKLASNPLPWQCLCNAVPFDE